ncbi:Alpha/Beta hydrolase protein [Trichoderma sp. SZMC 28013]
MRPFLSSGLSATLWGINSAFAQSNFPPEPIGLTEFFSNRQTSICETTPGVKAWSGYVGMPWNLLNKIPDVHVDYDINLYFWYFEARHNAEDAPTSIYLGGGPGYTALDSMSGFPCIIGSDSNSTTLNPFSWNNHVNMLYIEQPVGTGFSYSRLVNGTLDVLKTDQAGGPIFTPLKKGEELPVTNATVLAATLDSRGLDTTQNTMAQAARSLWQFAQVWFQEFPEYKTKNKEISLWSTSYGGIWGAGFFSYFINQNEQVSANKHALANAVVLPLATLGLGNGCIDIRASAIGYPHQAYNNTYGIKAYGKDLYDQVMGNITAPQVGCYDLADQCRAAARELDPTSQGNNLKVNTICQAAAEVCVNVVLGTYITDTMLSNEDITYPNIVSSVPNYYNGYFNQAWVQKDLGVAMFQLTGDAVIRDLSSLEHIIRSGIGGENISLSMDFPTAPAFRNAGYANLVTNSSYNGGVVRQHGNVSFSRVFEAGHSVTAYQPETVYQIFQRSMFGKDVATGQTKVNDKYSTKGPISSWGIKNKIPKHSPENQCYTYLATQTCTPEQIRALEDGTAVTKDFIVLKPAGIATSRL